MKGRCLICKKRQSKTTSGLLVPHVDATGQLCEGTMMMPEVPQGVGKRIVHRD